jgi:hypothetical protein
VGFDEDFTAHAPVLVNSLAKIAQHTLCYSLARSGRADTEIDYLFGDTLEISTLQFGFGRNIHGTQFDRIALEVDQCMLVRNAQQVFYFMQR